eukprot:gene6175-2790_t
MQPRSPRYSASGSLGPHFGGGAAAAFPIFLQYTSYVAIPVNVRTEYPPGSQIPLLLSLYLNQAGSRFWGAPWRPYLARPDPSRADPSRADRRLPTSAPQLLGLLLVVAAITNASAQTKPNFLVIMTGVQTL